MLQLKLLLVVLFVALSIDADTPKSQLYWLIPAEIKNDSLYQAIERLAKMESVHTILELGSSSGQGSTAAFVAGIRDNPSHPTLYCMEFSRTRFQELKKYYENDKFVRCYNVASVPLESFPQKSEIEAFYNTVPTNLNQAPLSMVMDWLRQDMEYIKAENIPQNGIELIKKENGIDTFDIVLIDSSEFTGMAELEKVYGARYLLLDDVNAFKNYANRQRLLKDPNYELIEEDLNLRNGYSIFKKRI